MPPVSNTISELQRSLNEDLLLLFPGNEAVSVSRLILEHLGFTPIDIAKNPAAIVQNKIHSEIKKILKELSQQRPIQYILGEAYFFDLTFSVNEETLIPRPETEELVSNILLDERPERSRIIDIGTGSGCIAIALSVNIQGVEMHAMDVKEATLKIARENAIRNQADVIFHRDDILNFSSQDYVGFDIVVSNPPYVTDEERAWMNPNVLEHEPEIALFVPDNDPLIFYRNILKFAESHLNPEGTIWVEINEKKGKQTRELFLDSGYHYVRLLKDIHGKDRFIKARRNAK